MGKGKGKKAKGNRLSRMSEEERQRYLQHRAALEEEARRRKQQLVAGFMKTKLRHEEAFTRLNAAKINQQWRAVLRTAKAGELRAEALAAQEAFEDTLRKKAQTVRTLQLDLRASELQYARNLHAHAHAVDTLLALHRDRLYALHMRYRAARAATVSRATERCSELRDARLRHSDQLRVATFLNTQQLEAFKEKRDAQHFLQAEELRNTMLRAHEDLTTGGDSAMERLWRQILSTMKTYAASTDDRRAQLVRLQQRDAEAAEVARTMDRRAERLEAEVERLRTRLRNVHVNAADERRRLTEERTSLLRTQSALRARMLRGTTEDQQRLLDLTQHSENALEELRRIEKKATRVLTLASLCRRLETQREKVLPWELGDSAEPTEVPLKQNIFATFGEKGLPPLPSLERFWLRYNACVLGCASLRADRKSVREDARRLRAATRACVAALAAAAAAASTGGKGKTALAMPLPALPPTVEGARAHTAVPASRRHLVTLPGMVGDAAVTMMSAAKQRPTTCVEAATSVAVRFPVAASGAW